MFGDTGDGYYPNQTGEAADEKTVDLVLVGKGAEFERGPEPGQDNDRVDKGGVIGQEKDTAAALFDDLVQAANLHAVAEPK